MSPPPQPSLKPVPESPDTMSPLVLAPAPAPPTSDSEVSLGSLSLGDYDSDASDRTSSAETDDSCASACCAPAPAHDTKRAPVAREQVLATVREANWSPLVIIGAGPHALALAARLNEPRPAALYTDLEHARLSWLQRGAATGADHRPGAQRQARPTTVRGHWPARKLVTPREATLARGADESSGGDSAGNAGLPVRVLDSSGSAWMSRWDAFFAGLSITHLRSPMTFHPSPADADALVGYARRTSRERELEPIKGVVGSEFSKYQRKKRRASVAVAGSNVINERDRQDYQRPSSDLFRDFLQDDLVERYRVPDVVHTAVTSIDYGMVHVQGEGLRPGFVIESVRPDGARDRHAAQAVAMAIGPSSVPAVPAWLTTVASPEEGEYDGHPWRTDAICGRGWCHSSAFAVAEYCPLRGSLGNKVRRGEHTRVCVVGGGYVSLPPSCFPAAAAAAAVGSQLTLLRELAV